MIQFSARSAAFVASLFAFGVSGLFYFGWFRRRRRHAAHIDSEDGVVLDVIDSQSEESDIDDTDDRLAAYRQRRSGAKRSEDPDKLLDQASQMMSLPSMKKRVLVLGLDGAGKTTLLAHLTNQPPQQLVYQPTDGVKMVDMATRNCTFNIWEIGGGEDVRTHWEKFFNNTEQLLFVVDGCSTDSRIALACDELERVMADSRLDGVPLILVVTHQDRLEARSPDEIAHYLKLDSYKRNRQLCQAVGVSLHFGQPPEGLTKLRSWMFPVMAHAVQLQDDIEEAKRRSRQGH